MRSLQISVCGLLWLQVSAHTAVGGHLASLCPGAARINAALSIFAQCVHPGACVCIFQGGTSCGLCSFSFIPDGAKRFRTVCPGSHPRRRMRRFAVLCPLASRLLKFCFCDGCCDVILISLISNKHVFMFIGHWVSYVVKELFNFFFGLYFLN